MLVKKLVKNINYEETLTFDLILGRSSMVRELGSFEMDSPRFTAGSGMSVIKKLIAFGLQALLALGLGVLSLPADKTLFSVSLVVTSPDPSYTERQKH